MANTENIRKWVDALRSGDYRQTTSQLALGGGYCCLGVACDISPVDDWDPYRANLPREIVEWLGVESKDPSIGGVELTRRNDIMHQSFPEIADLIEAEWLSDEPA